MPLNPDCSTWLCERLIKFTAAQWVLSGTFLRLDCSRGPSQWAHSSQAQSAIQQATTILPKHSNTVTCPIVICYYGSDNRLTVSAGIAQLHFLKKASHENGLSVVSASGAWQFGRPEFKLHDWSELKSWVQIWTQVIVWWASGDTETSIQFPVCSHKQYG